MNPKKTLLFLLIFSLIFTPAQGLFAAPQQSAEDEELTEITEDSEAVETDETAEAAEELPAEEETVEAEEPVTETETGTTRVSGTPVEEEPETAPAGASASSHQNYRIGVGDLLQIEVYDEEDLTKEVRVLTDGFISFPLLGALRAARRTVKELEEDITRKLAAKYLVNPQVTVFVKEFSNVFVFGEVKKPGSFPIYGKMTVFEAITLAGGFTEVANPKRVKVVREENGTETSFEVDTEKLTKRGDSSGDRELQANDRVIVPRSFF